MRQEVMQANRLSIAYDERTIVEELELALPQGKVTSIIGPNGCGKSTILKALGRILKPKQGSVYLKGRDIGAMKTKDIAREMAILPQTPKAPDGITVRELVGYGRYPHQKGFQKLSKEDEKTIDWAISSTGLSEYKAFPVDNLSGGQRQRVWIAMALAQQTELILLDEPTTYLDLSYQLEVLELLYDLNRSEGCSIVMVLHDLNLAARFSDYMVAVRDGRIVCHGTAEEVLCPAVLREVFRIDAVVKTDARTGKPVCVSYDRITDKEEKRKAG